MNRNNYIVAATKDWNEVAFEKNTSNLKGNWYLINSPEKLTLEAINLIKPRYIFFPHWSWIVPSDITSNFECVCFHMTDVPFGRGGTPLQNLIVRGKTATKLTALKMSEELDAGPVYGKVDLSLAGSAQEIYENASDLVYVLISRIIENNIVPTEQKGEVVHFERRSPEQSIFPSVCDIKSLYDHIRMLDAKSYPHAYINYENFRLEFTNAKNNGNTLECHVTITEQIVENDKN